MAGNSLMASTAKNLKIESISPEKLARNILIKGQKMTKLQVEAPGIRKKITLRNFDEEAQATYDKMKASTNPRSPKSKLNYGVDEMGTVDT